MNNQLILDYIPLANSLAFRKKQNVPNHISLDELKSAAYMGLVEAANRFNASSGAFYTYAIIRINGAIKDHLRSLMNFDKNNTTPDKCFYETNQLEIEDFFDFVCTKLDLIESRIIKMYYLQSKTMKEIGIIEEVSESRVSQIISKCHKKLKKLRKGLLI